MMIISSKLYKEYEKLNEKMWQELREINNRIDNATNGTRDLELQAKELNGMVSILTRFLHYISLENKEENSKKSMLKDLIENAIDEYFKKESEDDEK